MNDCWILLFICGHDQYDAQELCSYQEWCYNIDNDMKMCLESVWIQHGFSLYIYVHWRNHHKHYTSKHPQIHAECIGQSILAASHLKQERQR